MRNAIIILMVKDNRFQHDLNGFFSSTQSHKRHFIKTTLGFFMYTIEYHTYKTFCYKTVHVFTV